MNSVTASVRARLFNVAKARCKTQIDIGFGDAVTPGPVDATYPCCWIAKAWKLISWPKR